MPRKNLRNLDDMVKHRESRMIARGKWAITVMALLTPIAAIALQDSIAPAPEPVVISPAERPATVETAPDTAPMPPPAPVYVPIAPPSPVPQSRNKGWDIIVSPDGKSVHLVGQIAGEVTARLKTVLKQNPGIRTLILTSDGGLLIEGVGLAHVVRKQGLDTHVEYLCGSACTFPLLAGKQRSIAPEALVGFHQASLGPNPFIPQDRDKGDQPGNILMQATYGSANIGAPFIEKALATPPSTMWFPDVATLQTNGVVTRIAKAGEFPLSTPVWKSPGDFLKALDKDPLWAAARASKREDYGFAVASAWMSASLGKNADAAIWSARDLLVRRLLADAPAYPDALIGEFIAAERKIWDEGKSSINLNCEIGTSNRFPVSRPKTDEHRALQFAILQKMLAIPSPAVEPDANARDAAQAKVIGFWGRMVAEQSYNNYNVTNNFCRDPLNYWDEMAKMPPVERASLFRALILIDSSGAR